MLSEHRSGHILLAPVVQKVDSAIQWISIRETNWVIHWIEIYPVDSAIHLLNNWGLAANSLLLAREHSPDVNNKPISIPYLEQGYCWNITILNLKMEL